MISFIKANIKRLVKGRYSSLSKIDRILETYLDKDHGYFVELGANDGITQSNSLYFEKFRKWNGLLVEPTPHNFIACRKNRSKATKIFCAACVSFQYEGDFVRILYSNLMSTPIDLESDISDPIDHARSGKQFLSEGEATFEFGAVARTLNSLLLEAHAPSVIDFLSLDVEGAELEVLSGIDHSKFRFEFIVVECRDFERLKAKLEKWGYYFIRPLSTHDYLFSSKKTKLS